MFNLWQELSVLIHLRQSLEAHHLNYPKVDGVRRKAKDTLSLNSGINFTKTYQKTKAEPLRGIERLKALDLLKNPSRDHLKPFILCKLEDDCRTCKFRETCKTNAIAYINGKDMPYEPYWFRKAIANAIEKHTK